MNVKEFVEKYNNLSNELLKTNLLNGIIIKTYIPFSEKLVRCTTIANSTTHELTGEGTEYEKMIFKENTNARYLYFCLNIIDLYTDINIEWDNKEYSVVKQFEELDEHGLIEIILSLILEKTEKTVMIDDHIHHSSNEIEKFQTILDACIADITANENNLINYVDTKIDAFELVFNTLLDSVMKMFAAQMKANISEEDIEKLKELMKNSDNIVPFSNDK